MTVRLPSALSPVPQKAALRLDELCECPPTGTQEELVLWFIDLVRWLRPQRGQKATVKLRFLRARLAKHPEWRRNVSTAMSELLRNCDFEQLMTYGGIPREFHFGGALREWFGSRLLPSACRTSNAAQILRLAFCESDLDWLRQGGLATFLREVIDPSLHESLATGLTEALVGLAHQLVAQAHAPTVRSLSRSERSPFRGLYETVVAFNGDPSGARAYEAVRGRVKQCLLALDAHRAQLTERGADLNTTFQLARIRQQLLRLGLVAMLLHDPSDASIDAACVALVKGATRHARGSHLLGRSADLVVQNLVDTTATVGRSYLEKELSSFRAAFLAGMGGGALMAIATAVKFFLANRHLPPLYEGLVFSLNYAAAFCAAYLLHFTIATKLPSHTATALARSAQAPGGHRGRIERFLSTWRAMVRMQFAGLVGNLVVAAPLPLVFDAASLWLTGQHLLSTDKAAHVIAANSLIGPSFLYAALTGLFLWISSLLGAAGDNWTRVVGLSDRLATNVHVLKHLRPHRARACANAIVDRTGGMLGNASLGFLLGGVPAAFAIASIPIEIRHVTVSTSSVALAIAARGATGQAISLAVLGVLMIAIVNLVVSFVLALWLALRSAGSRGADSSYAIVRIGIRRWLRGEREWAGPRAGQPFDLPKPAPTS